MCLSISQLNNDVNRKINFYSNLLYACHTNPKVKILQDFVNRCITKGVGQPIQFLFDKIFLIGASKVFSQLSLRLLLYEINEIDFCQCKYYSCKQGIKQKKRACNFFPMPDFGVSPAIMHSCRYLPQVVQGELWNLAWKP